MTEYLEQYPEARKIEKESSHFHSIEKECKIKLKTQLSSDNRGFLGAYCITHKKNICRCGWEWHWHGGVHYKPKKYEWQKTQQQRSIK